MSLISGDHGLDRANLQALSVLTTVAGGVTAICSSSPAFLISGLALAVLGIATLFGVQISEWRNSRHICHHKEKPQIVRSPEPIDQGDSDFKCIIRCLSGILVVAILAAAFKGQV